jgi:hypothetical protein
MTWVADQVPVSRAVGMPRSLRAVAKARSEVAPAADPAINERLAAVRAGEASKSADQYLMDHCSLAMPFNGFSAAKLRRS